MAGNPVRTIRLRRLVAELKAARLAAGLGPEEAARAADLGRAWVYRVETFAVIPKVNNVKAFLVACGIADGPRWDRIVNLARDAARPGWWEGYGLSRDLAGFVALEAEASEKQVWEPALVPGLLQVPRYAREVITSGPDYLDPDQVERLVQVRLERQKALYREDPLHLSAVIDESVLRRAVGSAGVMHEQLDHLREAAHLPNVVLRVLPDRAGAHPGLTGTFAILRYPGDADSDIVYCETPAGSMYLERPQELERTHRAFSHLAALSLSPGATIDLVGKYSADL